MNFDEYLLHVPEAQRTLVMQLHEMVLSCDKGFTCAIKWNAPWYVYEGKNLVYIMPNKQHVNFGFSNGASLAEAGFELEGTGKGMRHVKLRQAEKPDLPLLKKMVKAAVALA